MLDRTIHDEVKATLTWLQEKDPGLGRILERSCGYAVFPAMGRAGLVVGGATGGGEVFEHGKPVGLATLSQLTIGVQVGGQTFSEVLVFQNKESLEAFKKNPITFTANASAVFIKAAATGTTDHAEVIMRAYSRGGMLLEASLGGQKFHFLQHQFKFLEEGGEGAKSGDGGAQKKATEKTAEKKGATEKANGAAGNGHGPQSDGEHVAEAKRGHGGGDAGSETGSEENAEASAPEHEERAGAEDGHEGHGRMRGIFRGASAKASHFIDTHGAHGEPLHPMGAAKGLVKAASSKATKFLSESRAAKGGRIERLTTGLGWLVSKDAKMRDKIKWMIGGIAKQSKIGPVLNEEVQAALGRLKERSPGLNEALEKAHGYAVIPSAGRASLVLGGSYGRGEIFQHGHLVGYAAIGQMTIGVQLGGETFDTLILFDNQGAFDRFKSGKIAFAANASVAFLTVGAAAAVNYASSTNVHTHPQGGLILELAIGGQKFVFRPAVGNKG